jgi:hypothetical protein
MDEPVDYLSGCTYPYEKNKSQWEGRHPIYEMDNKKCLKPPTSHVKQRSM